MKAYKYNGRLYSNSESELCAGGLDDLLYALAREHTEIYDEVTITVRYVGHDYFGTDEEKSDEETIESIMEDGYGDGIIEEVEI